MQENASGPVRAVTIRGSQDRKLAMDAPPEPYINNFDLERKPQSENSDCMPAERKTPLSA